MESITPNPLTEEWIRGKLSINTDNLEDIKSLSLPGTYQEKIVHLGDSLYKFSRIKELDLSRNSLISLEGLENLKYLEKLNLYFNSINSLKEIDRLANNIRLVEIDLRLNPIAKQDADYRLYLINILPSLQVCDDREIKDGEKQMALTYYNHKNLSKFERKPDYELYSKNEDHPQVTSSRVKSISNIVKRSAGIQEPSSNNDEEIVQNFLIHHVEDGADNLNRYSKNNQNSKPSFQQYSPQSLKELGERENREHQRRNCSSSNSTKKRSNSLQELTKEDKNLQFNDETEAGLAFKTRASFTPNPQYEEEVVKTVNNDNHKIKTSNTKDQHQEEVDEEIQNILSDKNNPIFNLLDLVDRYWNGTKSLHKNYKFLGLANQLLTQYTKYSNETNPFEVQNNLLQSQLKSSHEENRKLHKDLKHKDSERMGHEAYKKANQVEIDGLKKKVIVYQEENKRLKKEISERFEKTNNNFSIDSMESENDVLKKDVEVMKLKLKQYEQLQQLTAMLQESHKSLVTTNEHLLREISDTKSSSLQTNNNNNRNSFDIDDSDFFDFEHKISLNQQTSTLNKKLENRLAYSTTTKN